MDTQADDRIVDSKRDPYLWIKEHYNPESGEYEYYDEILKNLFGIEDPEELKLKEAEVCMSKLINIESVFSTKFDKDYFKAIHRHIFEDVFDWAGEYRTVPMIKIEEVEIPGQSLIYPAPEDIDKLLEQKINELNNVDWTRFTNRQDLALEFAKKIAAIWKVHPFRDGNTRTTLCYADMYARVKGFPFDMGMLVQNLYRPTDDRGRAVGYSIRDKFMTASIDYGYENPEYLAKSFDHAIIKGKLPCLKVEKDGEDR